MALTYTTFQTYPLEIAGITSEYNAKITAIENFVIEDLAYSGDAADVSAILKYFVFWFFCQSQVTTITAKTGETIQIQKTSIPALDMQIQNWNTGVDKLRTVFEITDEILDSMTGMTYEKIHSLVEATGKTVNEKYLSKRSIL